VPHDGDSIEIVHAGAAEGAVRGREAGWLDDMGLDAEAGAQAQNRSGVLRNIGLIEGDAHGTGRREMKRGCAVARRD
jgi:hypothetical protein